MWMDGLDPLREHGVRIIVVLSLLSGYVDQHNSVTDLRVFCLQYSIVCRCTWSPMVSWVWEWDASSSPWIWVCA